MKQKLFLSAASLLLAALMLCGCVQGENTSASVTLNTDEVHLSVHFIDVGQGDCILVESDGRFMLIDAGEYSNRFSVISYLDRAGVSSFDYIVATHPHSDHCGALAEVIRSFDASVLMSCDTGTESDAWNYVLDAADERGLTYETPDAGDTYALGSATFTVLSPSSGEVYSSLNNYSIVMMLEYEDTSFLLTGDAESVAEANLVNSEYDLTADVLKCGHHGSSSSTTDRFLNAVSPKYAVISCGRNNDYGHPHDEVLSALNERGITVYRTDQSGNIIARSDGRSISFCTEKSNTTDSSQYAPTATALSDNTSGNYIGNRNTHVFHLPSCPSVDKMKEKNRINFASRQEAVNDGYKPCGSCKP